jgi:competence protein ComEA
VFDQLERYRWLVVALFAVPLVVLVGFLISDRLSNPEPLVLNTADIPPTDIRVYITGAVVQPGVYPMEDGARWIDALEVAGGPAEDADLTGVNLSRRVRDEDQIIVPRIGEAPVTVAGAAQGPLINVNTASQSELESLPGIGPVRAGNIIASRTAEGPFSSVEDILERRLVPASVFENILPLITVGP